MTSTAAHAFLLQPDEEHPFGVMFEDDEPLEVVDQTAKTNFEFFIPAKSYLYKDMFLVEPDDSRIQVAIEFPNAKTHDDPFLEKSTQIYPDDVILPVTITFPKDYEGKSFSGKISYQGCSDKICYRLMSQKFNFTNLRYTAATSDSQVADKSKDSQTTASWFDRFAWRTDASFGYNLLVQSLFAIILGVLSSFSVCVLPLVPLTISFIGANQGNWRKVSLTLFVFVLGMISMNAPLGMMAAWLGLKFGFQYQNPWFLFGVSFLFFVMGLWMLGVFELQLPARLQTAVSKVHSKGLLRSYFSGLTIGVMAFACIGPFVLPLLAFVSSSKNLFAGFWVMAMYSLGLSGLFVVAAFFSTGWMRTFGAKSYAIKRFSGLVMVFAGIYFGWVFTSAHVLPHFQNAKTHENGFFQTDTQHAIELAQTTNRKLIVDFYADWCLPCQEWELKVWSKPEVQTAVLQGFVPLKIDCTIDTEQCELMTDQFKIKGMPTILFLNADQTEIKNTRLVGTVLEADDFIKLLQGIP